MATRLRAAGHEAGAFVGAFPLDSRFGLDAGFAVYNDRVGATGQSSDFLIAERPAETVVSAALQWLGDRTEPWFAPGCTSLRPSRRLCTTGALRPPICRRPVPR